MKDKNKLIAFFGIVPIISIVLISITMIFISIFGINKYFNTQIQKETKNLKFNTIYESKKDIKKIYGLISNINLIVTNSFRREIKTAVTLGFNMIDNIYTKNQMLPKDEIIQKIKNNLNNLKFYNDKSGYFFMYDMKGKLLMLPISKALEGRNFWDYKDIKGKFVIREFIKKLKMNPNGVFDKWYYYKPDTYIIQQKLGYAKEFKPLNIFIGTAVYEDVIKKEIDKRIKQFVSKITLKIDSQKLIIMCDKGNIIYASNRKLLNTTQYTKFKNLIKLAKQNSDKIIKYRNKNKLMIFVYYAPLKLIIMKEVDLKLLSQSIATQKKNMKKVIHLVIKQFLMTALVFIVIILLITIYFTHLIKNIFYRYDESLNEAKVKAELAAKAKSEFLANMSHEIRTPLNAMFGFITILQDKKFDKESKKYLDIIEKSGLNLLTIINDILDFSKIESGKFKIEYIDFNPKEEIEVVYELFSSKASEKNILLKIQTDNIKYNIKSDPTRIKQVISNLLSNAIKFTPKDKSITLYLKYNEKDESLFVSIKDEGIGISKDKLNNIFDAFSQADTSTTRKYGGTGLGLTISYKLVQLLGGELKVKSEIGKGSEFYFTIPAKKGDVAKFISEKKKTTFDEKYNYHVLVVEDNKANQMFMKVILKKMGITLDIADNGKIAVEKFRNHKYDFILMDENMPEMDGIEATKKIREYEKEQNLGHIIIIALTANALDGDKNRFILAGMDYYLSKPLDIDKLKEILMLI